jgi:hypothetical protein
MKLIRAVPNAFGLGLECRQETGMSMAKGIDRNSSTKVEIPAPGIVKDE